MSNEEGTHNIDAITAASAVDARCALRSIETLLSAILSRLDGLGADGLHVVIREYKQKALAARKARLERRRAELAKRKAAAAKGMRRKIPAKTAGAVLMLLAVLASTAGAQTAPAPEARRIEVHAGASASAGLGYKPVGGVMFVTVPAGASVEFRTMLDVTPKESSGHGWNLHGDGWYRSGPLMVGLGAHVWSDGSEWTKAAAVLLAGVRFAEGVRLVASSTLEQSHKWGAWNRSIALQVEPGRFRFEVRFVRFTQAEARTGVEGYAAFRVF
jgi:hypothetical protein